jgi:hypothetical protein
VLAVLARPTHSKMQNRKCSVLLPSPVVLHTLEHGRTDQIKCIFSLLAARRSCLTMHFISRVVRCSVSGVPLTTKIRRETSIIRF